MKCQNCGENEANVKYTQIINGVKKQMSLCDKCAQELGIDDMNFSMPINFSSFLGDMFDMYEDTIPTLIKPEVLACNKCNMTFDEFLNTGKFGCDNCYDTFEVKLNPILKNIHGTNKHVGRIGKYLNDEEKNANKKIENAIGSKEDDKSKSKDMKDDTKQEDKRNEKQTKLEELQERLKKEIAEERYEDAAKTRDEIKKKFPKTR